MQTSVTKECLYLSRVTERWHLTAIDFEQHNFFACYVIFSKTLFFLYLKLIIYVIGNCSNRCITTIMSEIKKKKPNTELNLTTIMRADFIHCSHIVFYYYFMAIQILQILAFKQEPQDSKILKHTMQEII
jgi:hypothetical protein